MNETQALSKIEPMPEQSIERHAGPLDMEPVAFRAGLDRRKENRQSLMDWIRSALVENVDYGRIPTKRGPSKPSLFKPGAEKICGMLGIITTFPTLTEYEQAALKGIEIKSVVLRCALLDSRGIIVAEGVGARSLAQDYGDLNKALKMAEKSAHIDATLRMAGLSEVFTQDIEDMPPAANVTPPKPPTTDKGTPKTTPKPAELATEDQRKRWLATLKPLGQAALDYAYHKGWLLPPSGPDNDRTPGEPLEMLDLKFVPTTKGQADAILREIEAWMDGSLGPSEPSNNKQVTTKTSENTVSHRSSEASKRAISQSEKESWHSGASSDSPEEQPWFNAVVPIPHRGMKRDEYMKQPDTIGELYNLRHDDEQARRRLFGFLHNFEPKGWTGRDGKPRPPSDSDEKFRDDLDQFGAWFEENHPDEANQD